MKCMSSKPLFASINQLKPERRSTKCMSSRSLFASINQLKPDELAGTHKYHSPPVIPVPPRLNARRSAGKQGSGRRSKTRPPVTYSPASTRGSSNLRRGLPGPLGPSWDSSSRRRLFFLSKSVPTRSMAFPVEVHGTGYTTSALDSRPSHGPSEEYPPGQKAGYTLPDGSQAQKL